MASDTEPIPIQDALRLCDMAIEDCDKTTPEWGEGWLERRLNKPDVSFLILSRAVMRPLIEMLKRRIEFMHGHILTESVATADTAYPPLAALRDHYDKTRPGWRQE